MSDNENNDLGLDDVLSSLENANVSSSIPVVPVSPVVKPIVKSASRKVTFIVDEVLFNGLNKHFYESLGMVNHSQWIRKLMIDYAKQHKIVD